MYSSRNLQLSKRLPICILFITIQIACFCQSKPIVLISKDNDIEPLFSFWASSSSIDRMQRPLRKNQYAQSKNIDNYVFVIYSTEPLLFNFSWDFRIQPVWLFPGDTLQFSKTSSNVTPFQFDGSRPNNELMFYSILEASNLGYMAGNHELEVTTSLNFQKVEEETFERYQTRLKVLGDMVRSGRFSNKGKELITKNLYYQYLSELLFPYQAWKPIHEIVKNNTIVPDSYKIKLRQLSKELHQDTLVYLLDYKRFILQYARFLEVESLKIVDMSTLLKSYQKKFSGKIRDCLLFDEIYLDYLISANKKRNYFFFL